METAQTQTTEPMPHNPVARAFVDALRQAETSGDLASLVGQFAPEAELLRLNGEPYRGVEGARAFWQEYLAHFGVIGSRFNHVTEGENATVLEWVSEGTLADGQPLRYRGVSVLEAEGDKIARFRTYYDSAVFTPFGTKNTPTEGEPPSAG